MHMKKLISLLLVPVMAMSLFAGCGTAPSETELHAEAPIDGVPALSGTMRSVAAGEVSSGGVINGMAGDVVLTADDMGVAAAAYTAQEIAEVQMGDSLSIYNVKQYGATGDGETDDTEAISDAIDALPVGGTLYFPEGVYRVSNINVKSNMIIKGAGWCSIIKLLDATTDYHGRNNCLNIENVENVIIRDIKLDGNRSTQQSTASAQDARLNGLHMRYASDIYVENVWMYNNGYHGCIMTYTSNVVFSHCRATDNGFRPIHGHTRIYNCRVSNSVCENNGLGLKGGSGFENDSIFFFGAERLVINDNIVRSNRRGCITVSAEQGSTPANDRIVSSDITITGNVCECYEDLAYIKTAESDTGVAKFSSQGIVVYGGKYGLNNVTVSGNTIRNAHEAIYLCSSDKTQTSINTSVTGNSIIDCSFGVYAAEVSDVTITGNQFKNLKERLIYLRSVERCLIQGNNAYALDTNDNRFCRMDASKNVTISNNQFVSNASLAVYSPEGNNNIVVINNTLSGFTADDPIHNVNGVTQGNILLDKVFESEEPDTPEPDTPVEPEGEIVKMSMEPYVNNGFVRDSLVNPNTTSTNYLYTDPVEITDADVKYELNTYASIPAEYTNPADYTISNNTAIVFLSGTELTSAVGIVSIKGGNGTLSYSGTNIPGTSKCVWGVTVSITANEVKQLFPTAKYVMMQTSSAFAKPDQLASAYRNLNDGYAYVYRLQE